MFDITAVELVDHTQVTILQKAARLHASSCGLMSILRPLAEAGHVQVVLPDHLFHDVSCRLMYLICNSYKFAPSEIVKYCVIAIRII
jgi:hypothetical protein